MRPAHLLLALLPAAALAAADPPAGEQLVEIRTLTAQMRYDTAEFTVPPGSRVRVRFHNTDDLPHNLVFCQAGTDVVAMSMKQMEKPDEALGRNWLPDHPAIWAHSRMLNPRETQELRFTAPERPGRYPFVCTFPGHALTMRGEMKVYPQGGKLRDLQFRLYLGEWTQLPAFDQLSPHRAGPVEGGEVRLKLDDYRNHFGVVFTGRLAAPRKGAYRFYLASDDGGRILVNGSRVVEQDGIHPAGPIKSGSVQLEKGDHEFRLEYFQATGDSQIFAAWKGADFEITPLSTWLHPDWKEGGKRKADETTGMPLVVGREPVVYRNFIEGAGNRAIAVGYPGGFNIAWSAESMNLALVWRGAFLDAARHWNSRGGGHQPPLGYDVIRPSGGLSPALAVLAAPETPWPATDGSRRDAGYRWKGYRLDAARAPTFLYEWNGFAVEDTFAPRGSATTAGGELRRSLRLRRIAKGEGGAHWLVLSGNVQQEADDQFVLDGRLVVRLGDVPARPLLRGQGAARQLLVPIGLEAPETRCAVSYSWRP